MSQPRFALHFHGKGAPIEIVDTLTGKLVAEGGSAVVMGELQLLLNEQHRKNQFAFLFTHQWEQHREPTPLPEQTAVEERYDRRGESFGT